MVIVEQGKSSQPVCKDLIFLTKDCDIDCPYRHFVTEYDDTFVPHYGFVNMQLIDVLAPNHFSVRVVSHKRQLKHKSKPVQHFDEQSNNFDHVLQTFYSDKQNLQKTSRVVVGDLYLFIYAESRTRCRVTSKSKKSVHIYLIDVGKKIRCTESDLFYLHDDFHTFPPGAVEMFVLDIVPCNLDCLPEAKQVVKSLMHPLKEADQTDKYLQAEVITAFDRTLIVKDLKIIFKTTNQLHKMKEVARTLIKLQLADKVESIKLPAALKKPVKSLTELSELTSEAFAPDSFNSKKEDLALLLSKNSNIHPTSSSPDSSNNFDEWPDKLKESQNVEKEEMTLRENFVSNWAREQIQMRNSFGQASASPHSDVASQHELVMEPVRSDAVSSLISLDDIFGSLPEDVQSSVEVLVPIQYARSDEVDATKPTELHQLEEADLIYFSD